MRTVTHTPALYAALTPCGRIGRPRGWTYWATPLHYAFATLVIGEVNNNYGTYGAYGRYRRRPPLHPRVKSILIVAAWWVWVCRSELLLDYGFWVVDPAEGIDEVLWGRNAHLGILAAFTLALNVIAAAILVVRKH
jgi:hypothetical protein